MDEIRNTPASPNLLDGNPYWQLVLRVAASRYFQKSPKMRVFLLYVCEKALTQCTDEIREQQIGATVFGRKPDYNPSEDSIVRTEAWEMRRRLEKFFLTEGKDEPMILTIPRGSYLPVFRAREEVAEEITPSSAATNAAGSGAVAAALPVSMPGKHGTHNLFSPSRSRRAWPFFSLLLLIPLIGLGWDDYRQRNQVSQLTSDPTFPAGSLWWNLFDDRHETKVVLGDSSLVSFQRLAQKEVGLDDYSTLRYLGQIDNPDLKRVAEYSLVNMNIANIAARIAQRNRVYGQRMQIRFARDMKGQDFKTNHLILIGSRYSVRWIDLFDDRLNFYFDFAATIRPPMDTPAFLNRKPNPGEEKVYVRRQLNEDFVESYAVIAHLPNLDSTGNVLMIAGLTPADCDGATELLLSPDFSTSLPQELTPSKNHGRWPHFELLVKTNYFQNLTKKVSPVTFRVLPR